MALFVFSCAFMTLKNYQQDQEIIFNLRETFLEDNSVVTAVFFVLFFFCNQFAA